MDLLIEKETIQGKTVYKLNTEMQEFIRAIKDKFRVYLMTKIKAEGDTTLKIEHEKIHEDLLMKLVKQDIIKGKHRLLYSSTDIGHVAQIRQLGA